MKLNRIYVVLVISSFLFGCEGFSFKEGVVKDKTTDKPLSGVYCNVITGKESIYTDSTDKYKVSNPMGSCISGCKEIMVEFSKPGYKTLTLQHEEDGNVVYLEK